MNDLILYRPGSNILKRITLVNGNVPEKNLVPSLYTIQVTDIRRILSPELYNKILADYNANTLTGIYLTIYDEHITPMLVFYATADFIMKNNIIVAAGGNFKHKPENGEVAEIREVERLSRYYRDMGAHYELEFYEFMKDKNVAEYKRDCVDINTFKFPWYL